VASRSGYSVIVVIGLIALGSAGDQGCDPAPETAGDAATDAGEFSFDPGPGATTADEGDDAGEFSFDPDPGATTADEGGDGGAGDDFSFEPDAGAPAPAADEGGDVADEGGDDGEGALSTCNDVVATSSTAGQVPVPGDDRLLGETTLECRLDPGDDDEAVAALQVALAQCNGQDVAVDGAYGAETGRAVTAVERQHGLTGDGTYDAATALVMRWPAGDECAPLGTAGG
jgi:hypothetical protein